MGNRVNEYYLKNLEEKIQRLPEGDQALGRKLVQITTLEDYHYDAHIRRFKRELERNAPSLQEKLGKLKELTEKLLPSYYVDVLNYIIEHAAEYAYRGGYDRRPFRTAEQSAHFDVILSKCLALHAHAAAESTLLEWLVRRTDFYDYSIASDLIAYEIDQQNEEIRQLVRQAVFGDNNIAVMSRDLIKGMVLSHDQEMYELLGQLLIAARLQEGLRQSIAETMDEGSLDATVYLLRVIIEHDLIRYSSVVRAISTWTGIVLEVENKRILKQLIDYMYQALTDETVRTEWQTSPDTDKLYISLWATAVHEEQLLPGAIAEIMKSGEFYQKVTALHLLHESENTSAKYAIASRNLGVSETGIEAMVIANYPDTYDYKELYRIQSTGGSNRADVNYIAGLADEKERNRQFLKLMGMLQAAPPKEVKLASKLFNGLEIHYSADAVAKKILYLISYDRDVQKLNALLEHRSLFSSETKAVILEDFIHHLEDTAERNFVFSSLADRSSYNRELALKKVQRMALNTSEVVRVETLLKLKTGVVRQAAIKILMKLDLPELKDSIRRLISSKNELLRLGALEMLTEIKDKKTDQFSSFQHEHLLITVPTPKEQIFLDKLAVQEKDAVQDGFGLYSPKNSFTLFKDFPAGKPLMLHDLLRMETGRFEEILSGLVQLVHQHRDAAYEVEWYGSTNVYLVGAEINRGDFYDNEDQPKGTGTLPLPPVWSGYFKEKNVTPDEFFQFGVILSLEKVHDYYLKLCQIEATRSSDSSKWRKELFESIYPMESIARFLDFFQTLQYQQQLTEIITAFFEDRDKQVFFDVTCRMINTIIETIPLEKRREQSGLFEYLAHPWLEWLAEDVTDDSAFSRYFMMKYKLYTWKNFRNYHPTTEEINRAFSLELIDRAECFRELLERNDYEQIHHLYYLTERKASGKFKALEKVKSEIIERLLEIELKRGDLPTPASRLAVEIEYFEGLEHFLSILKALDGETFARGYFYAFDEQYAKKDVLSQLLKNCHPRNENSAGDLARMLEGFPVSDKRLLEAAMYAPQWTDIIAEHLGWSGLKKAIWYFHAHTSEFLSAEKETIIARYSPISPEQFNDGAFDIEWFEEAYRELGKDRFELLYQCAKYISTGALHRRAQLFADAATGKLDAEELKTGARIKRNKEHLLCYSLLPIKGNQEASILERYEFIQQFLTDSRKFGAQRRASEAKTVEMALENLAKAGGYEDLTRMRWTMEGRKMEAIQPYMVPIEIEGYRLYLAIDEKGKSRLKISKNEKELAAIPSKLKKNDYVQKLKEINGELKEQFSRNRIELEKSMISQTAFRKNELDRMQNNPTVAPLIRNLVFQVGEHFGFLEKNGLVQLDGEICVLQETDEAKIAHCLNLQKHGVWSAYQRMLFDSKVIQPFKQVFRELYLLNADEKSAGYRSLRYAGHQLQPAKAAALFRGRSWTVHYEEGLQKVYHRENIIATIEAMADWFSPADMESPTLEHVAFYDRKTYKPLQLTDVPPILFSETMRDVDLAVSSAHVGGVDPEASLTTIEMRKAIVQESLRLTQTDNVRIEGNFAYIKGILAEYGVHLGSGSVQQQATGSLYIIPVHSQHRGRLFLPFLDEDPKTAEVLAKILLLANDIKIRDPHILEQIKR